MRFVADRRSWSLVVVDGIALLVFVVVGVRSHHEGDLPSVLARNLIPLVVAWYVVAWAAGTYRRPGVGSLALTWVIAIPLGLLARSLWVGSPTGGRFFVFLGVGMAFTLLFLLVGRSIHRLATRRVLPAGPQT